MNSLLISVLCVGSHIASNYIIGHVVFSLRFQLHSEFIPKDSCYVHDSESGLT